MYANNVLFCINIRVFDRSLDVALYSLYPDKEEQLARMNFCHLIFFMGKTLDLVLTNPDRFTPQVVPLQS
jgi:hypothetical protein